MDRIERNDLARLAYNAYYNIPSENYSRDDSLETFRKALVELNGSENFTRQDMRRARTNGVYELIETTIQKVTNELLPEGHPIFQFVERKNLAEGDKNEFFVEDDDLYVVSKIVHGTKQIRRQRLTGGETFSVETDLYGIKIYEEMRRLIAGRTDIVKFINKVAESFARHINEVMTEAVMGAFDKLQSPYAYAGTYDEAKLLEIIDHVEASTGKKAVVLGSKQAVRKIDVSGSDANSAKEDKYNMGYYGHIASTPVIAMQNAHKANSTEFILKDELYIVAADDKFVKFVTEGETMIIDDCPEQPMGNHALQKEYMMAQAWGVEVVFAADCGVYRLG